jgi:hypothetical protein
MSMRRMMLAATFLLGAAGPAMAHASGRGFVMLLPTNYVIWGGALAVLVSFVAVSLLPHRAPDKQMAEREAGAPSGLGVAVSLLGALMIGLIIVSGLMGPNDPAENLLPLGVWTLWWVVIVLLHPLFGNLWGVLNPFTGPHAVLMRGRAPPFSYPGWLSYWPAVVIFFAFAWFQLVYPAPEDRDVLALVLIAYLGFTLLAVLLFGPGSWLRRGDPFGVFLHQLGSAAPMSSQGLRLPGAGLLSLPPLPLSGTLFVLLTLSSISFDGFANTFFWLSRVGINPLDYPGRTAMMGANTLGLLGSFIVLAAFFFGAVFAGWLWSGRSAGFLKLCGRLVYSLIPISIAYHFAHYLGDTLVNLQYLAVELSDPFHTGADLLGLGDFHVTASFLNTASGTLAIFTAQTAAIVLGHIVGVAVAHAMLAETELPRAGALRLEGPLAISMVAYTAFGLWLLAAPSIA